MCPMLIDTCDYLAGHPLQCQGACSAVSDATREMCRRCSLFGRHSATLKGSISSYYSKCLSAFISKFVKKFKIKFHFIRLSDVN
jgi:hypothetical protein